MDEHPTLSLPATFSLAAIFARTGLKVSLPWAIAPLRRHSVYNHLKRDYPGKVYEAKYS